MSIDFTSKPSGAHLRKEEGTRHLASMGEIIPALKYGYQSSVSGFYDFLANIPGGINRLNDYLVEKTGTGVASEDTVLGEVEGYLRRMAIDTSPESLKMVAPESTVAKIYAGMASVPAELVKYIPSTKLLGSAAGFAAVEAIDTSDGTPEEIAVAATKGAMFGKILEGASALNVQERVAALGGIGFGTSEGDLSDKVAAGVTFASLGMLGKASGDSVKNYIGVPAKDPIIKMYRTHESELADVNKMLKDSKTQPGLRPTLEEMRAELQSRMKVLEDVVYTKEKLSNKLLGQDMRSPREVAVDLVDKNGARKYEDLSTFGKEISGRLQAGKFVDNPVVKWSVDRLSRHRVTTEHAVDTVLHAPKFENTKWGLTGLRNAKIVKTDAGALTAFEKLNHAEKSNVILTGFEVEKLPRFNGKEVDELDLAGLGLSATEISAYNGLRKGVEEVRRYYNKAVETHGGGEISAIDKLPNYLPHVFLGDFAAVVKDSSGNVTHVLPANSKMQAKRLASNLEGSSVIPRGGTVYSGARYRNGKSDVPVQAFADAIRMTKDPQASAILEKAYEDVLAASGFRKHKLGRKGVKGFAGEKGNVKDFMKGYTAYVEGGIRAAENLKARKEIRELLSERAVVTKFPNASEYVNRYMNNALGQKGNISQTVSDLTRDWVGEHGVGSAIANLNTATLYAKLMFGNVRFILSQGVQPYQMIPAKLTDMKARGFNADIMSSVLKAQRDFVLPTKEAKEVIRYAVRNRTIAPKFLDEFAGEHIFQKGASSMSKKALDAITLKDLSARAEQWSRMQSTLQFYHFLRDGGVPHRKAVEDSAYLTDKYMVEYNSYERPMIFGEGGLGVLGKPFGLFKTYQHNYLAQLVERAKTMKDTKDPSSLAVFAGGMVLAAGLQGVIGIQQADFLLNSLGHETVTSRLLRSGLSDWAVWGVPSASTQLDLTTTLAAPGLGASDLMSMPSLEYAGSITSKAFSWAKHKASNTATDADAEAFYKAIAPVSMHGMIERYYNNEEFPVRDPNKKSRGTINRDLHDWVARGLSSRSIKESTILKAAFEVMRTEKAAANNQDTLVASGAYLLGINEDIPDVFFDRAIENGYTPKQYVQQIKNRYKLMSTTFLDRLAKCRRSPKCIERAKFVEEALAGTTSGEK